MSGVVPTRTVRLLAVPTELYVRHQMHLDDLVHELRIVKVGQEQGSEVPGDLTETIAAILDAYVGPRDAAIAQATNALQRGDVTVDIEVDLPVDAADAAVEVVRLLEVADRLAAAGSLLTLPADEDIRQLRWWVSREVARQLEGEDPVPYDAAAPNEAPR